MRTQGTTAPHRSLVGALIAASRRRIAVLLPGDPVAAASLVALLAGSVYVVLSKRTPKALGFAVLTLAAFFVQVADAFFGNGGYTRELVFTTPDTAEGDWWRPFSYLFVHADLGHIAGNLLVLVIVGPVLEDRVGARRWTALYLGGGALVVLSHVLFYPTERVAALGASGAVFAVVGALAIVAGKTTVPVPLGMFFMPRLPVWVMALLYTLMNVAYALSPRSGIAWYGHFAGMAIGIAAGAWFAKRHPEAKAGKPLVDADRLAPLATTRRLEGFLERYRAIQGETPDDAHYREAWLDRFLKAAACPVCGATGLTLQGDGARCPNGHEALPRPPPPP